MRNAVASSKTVCNGYILMSPHSTDKQEVHVLLNKWCVHLFIIAVVGCHRPPVPTHGSTEGVFHHSGARITFRCDPGFELRGFSTAICLSDGTWSAPAPQCGKILPQMCTKYVCFGLSLQEPLHRDSTIIALRQFMPPLLVAQ